MDGSRSQEGIPRDPDPKRRLGRGRLCGPRADKSDFRDVHQALAKDVRGRHDGGSRTHFPEAARMILERPIVGWGPVNHYFELGARLGARRRDTHNLVLWVLTQVGLVGAIPFFGVIAMALAGAWRARRGHWGVVPLAMMTSALLTNMSVTWLQSKTFWVAMAFALAAGAQRGAAVAQAGSRTTAPSPRSGSRGEPSRLARAGRRESVRGAARKPHSPPRCSGELSVCSPELHRHL